MKDQPQGGESLLDAPGSREGGALLAETGRRSGFDGHPDRHSTNVVEIAKDRVVNVLHEDPDFAQDLEPEQAKAASRLALARVVSVAKGEFSAHEKLPSSPGMLGMQVLEGLLLRGVSVAVRPSLEVFGPGDVVRPRAPEVDLDATLPVVTRWWALRPASLAVLDASFTRRMSDYPGVIGEVASRLARGSAAGGVRLSIVQQPRLSTRLHFMLWHLADRFGRVTSDGVILPVPLCHGLLSWLVGASRPAVCRAVGELEHSGLLARRHDDTWWLGRPLEDVYS